MRATKRFHLDAPTPPRHYLRAMAKTESLTSYAAYAKECGARLTDSPLQTTKQARVAAPPNVVWNFITDFSRLDEWIPLATRSRSDDTNAEEPGGVGAVRVIHAAGAPKPTLETVIAKEAPRMLAYSAADENLFGMFTKHLSVLTVEPHPSGDTVFTWLAYGVQPRNRLVRIAGSQLFDKVLASGTKKLVKKYAS